MSHNRKFLKLGDCLVICDGGDPPGPQPHQAAVDGYALPNTIAGTFVAAFTEGNPRKNEDDAEEHAYDRAQATGGRFSVVKVTKTYG
jgi:hypothetical protein